MNLYNFHDDPKHEYAKNVIGGAWLKGEDAIASDSNTAFWYASQVLGARFPKGEKRILDDPNYVDRYKELFQMNE